MIPDDWISQRRGDGEVVGYVAMVDDRFRPYDLLGRPLGEPTDWSDAESIVDRTGLAFLAEPHVVDLDGERRVRLVEVTRAHVTLIADEFGAAQVVGAAAQQTWVLDLPIAVRLRPLR